MCVSLQRAVTVVAEDMIDGLAKVNAQLSNLRTDGNRSRGWREGSLEKQLRNRHHIDSLARTPGVIPLVAIIAMSSRGRYESVVGKIGHTRIDDLSGSYINRWLRTSIHSQSDVVSTTTQSGMRL